MGKPDGAVAQLGERCNGIAEVRGSIPLGSTTVTKKPAQVAGFLLSAADGRQCQVLENAG